MEDKESNVGKKLPSIPANYVSLAQLQERWIKEKERKEREKDEQEQHQKQKKEESEREFQKGRSKGRQNRKPNGRRGKEGSQADAVLTVTAAEGAESETNNEGQMEKKQTTKSWNKKENLKGGDKEHVAVEAHKPPATSIVGEDRRRPQRRSEGAPKDTTLGIERSFDGLSLNLRIRRDSNGYSKFHSSNFNGGTYSRQFAGPAKVWDRGYRTPTNMMWVKKGMVADTDGDAFGTQSLNKK